MIINDLYEWHEWPVGEDGLYFTDVDTSKQCYAQNDTVLRRIVRTKILSSFTDNIEYKARDYVTGRAIGANGDIREYRYPISGYQPVRDGSWPSNPQPPGRE